MAKVEEEQLNLSDEEVIRNESSEEEEDGANAAEGQESLTMIEFLEKQEEHKRAREMVRQEQQADPYVEKLFQ